MSDKTVTVTIAPPPLYCGVHTEHHAIVAIDVCGCIGGISVIEHHEPEAYQFASREAKAGLRVETWTVEVVRSARMTCAEHPDYGPPWWESNHVKGTRRIKRPTNWQAA